MSDRNRLSQLFEEAAQAFLEISRIMLKAAQKDSRQNKREYAIEQKVKNLEERTAKVLNDLSRPHPEQMSEATKKQLHNLKEKL